MADGVSAGFSFLGTAASNPIGAAFQAFSVLSSDISEANQWVAEAPYIQTIIAGNISANQEHELEVGKQIFFKHVQEQKIQQIIDNLKTTGVALVFFIIILVILIKSK